MSELSKSEKQTFLAATNRRKANNIRLKRFSVMADESQISALNELWESWVIRFGKQKAVDVLIKVMSNVEARLVEQDGRKK